MDFRVYVIVEMPILDRKVELLVPIDRRMHELYNTLKHALPYLSNGYYKDKVPSFYRKSSGELIGFNDIIKDTGIKNGTRIVLV